VVVTTPVGDKSIVELAKTLGCEVHRWTGDENDVSGRFRAVVEQEQPDVFLRVTGDCPLVDPNILKSMVYIAETTTTLYIDATKRYLCDGVGAELVDAWEFLRINPNRLLPDEREHVTCELWTRWAGRCRDGTTLAPRACWDKHKLSIDWEGDYKRLQRIFAQFGPEPDTVALLTLLAAEATRLAQGKESEWGRAALCGPESLL